ncbi:uncharacterized protein BDW43DRAFT_290070, partial [Aspergillus alliaceus]|uniref:uncharacterized protein n=1 Tax=Petromyces alliaceus TaxID=209559 RepID=UPI0012A57A8A
MLIAARRAAGSREIACYGAADGRGQGTRSPLNVLLPCTEVDHWFLKLLGFGNYFT